MWRNVWDKIGDFADYMINVMIILILLAAGITFGVLAVSTFLQGQIGLSIMMGLVASFLFFVWLSIMSSAMT